jgi:hypothetical protein
LTETEVVDMVSDHVAPRFMDLIELTLELTRRARSLDLMVISDPGPGID